MSLLKLGNIINFISVNGFDNNICRAMAVVTCTARQ